MSNKNSSPHIRFPRSEGLVLGLYLLLTSLMTWPTVLHLTDGIPGDGFDGWQNYWNLWWVKEALLVLKTNPFFTDYIYPPTGSNLLFHTLNIFNAFWTLPLQLNLGPVVAYNSIVFFSFVLAGYGGYLLSLHTLAHLNWANRVGLRSAAFVGGLVFTMSPFHMAHLLGHMQVFSMIWPPFYILYLLRTLDPWGTPACYSPRNAALACLFLSLATLVDWYHTLYLLLFTGLLLAWVLIRQVGQRKRQRPQAKTSLLTHPLLRPVWLVLAIGAGFALFFWPLLLPMVREAQARPDLQTGLSQNISLSADLLAFIIPSEMHPLWGQWAKTIADGFSTTTSERLIFAGFVPLALALFIIIKERRQLIVKFWLLVAVTFFLLALGPFLHIRGSIIHLGDWPLPLPYLLLYYTVPFIGLTRSLSRYDLMVMLALAVLVAMALTRLQGMLYARHRSKSSPFAFYLARFAPFLAGLLICFEFLPVPYPVSKLEIPAFYVDIGAEAEDYVIAELPMNWDRPTPLLHQVTHGKRLLTAYTSRNNPLELAWRTPVLQHWRYLAPDIIDQELAAIAPTIFFDFNLRYIVLDYWQMPPGPEREATERWVAASLPGIAPIYDDGRLKVYQSPPKQETQPYLTLGDGWSDRQENGPDSPSRTFEATEQQPELFLHHPQNKPLRLEITASTATPHTLTVFAGAEPVGELHFTETVSTQPITLPPLTSDLIKLRFRGTPPTAPVSVSRIRLEKVAN